MTVLAGDVRGFYSALGVGLPTWAQRNVSVRCFANPEAHAHEDRRPSCSVSLESGAWRCWGCGAAGGAYDAALAVGHSPRSAIDLMVAMGLTERRVVASRSRGRRMASVGTIERASTSNPRLRVSKRDVERWHQALLSDSCGALRDQLAVGRGWSVSSIHELGLGYDGQRITIPILDGAGDLRGLLRYRIARSSGPKMLASPGTRLGLVPHPASERSGRLLVVEGPPDMIAARSHGSPAIAVPGDHAWRQEWAALLAGRTVTVVMDCDAAGRSAAERIAADLRPVAAVTVIDLAPDRSDGFDLTDWLLAQPPQRRSQCRTSSSSRRAIRR